MGFKGAPRAQAGFAPIKQSEIQDLSLCKDPILCGYQLFVGIFFDGTGNNKYEEEAAGEIEKYTNVTKLWDVYPFEPQGSRIYKRHYIQGVGTSFNEIDETSPHMYGASFAAMGQARINWALVQLLNSVHDVLIGGNGIENHKAKDFCVDPGNFEYFFLGNLNRLIAQTNTLQKKITQINLSVFGFSRGAAQARSFINQLLGFIGKSKDSGGFAGSPISFDFLGLFDTVASVGVSDMPALGWEIVSGHLDWASPELLRVPSVVEKCVHMVAAHEQRACFPVDLVSVNGSYPSNCDEYVFMGAHSDVGGGYKSNELGTPSNKLRLIPLQHMYFEALRAGVPLLPQSDKNIQRDFQVPVDLANAYNSYLEATEKLRPNSIAEHLRVHNALWLHINMFFDKKDPLVVFAADQVRFYNDIFTQICQSKDVNEPINVSELVRGKFSNLFPVEGLNLRIRAWFAPFSLMTLSSSNVDFKDLTEGLNTLADAQDISALLSEFHTNTDATAEKYASSLTTLMLGYVHNSQAGFIKQLKEGSFGVISRGEWSLNTQGMVRYRRIYSGSEQSVHIKPKHFKESKDYKFFHNDSFSTPKISSYQPGSSIPNIQNHAQKYLG